jgi:glucosamine-6-phosphate deaminase
MASRRVVMIAMGDDKQDAVYGAVKGPVTPHLPASILQMHQDCILLCDRKAAAQL